MILDKPHSLKSIASYRIEYNPSQIRGGDPNNPRPSDLIIREEKVAPGRIETCDPLQPRPARQEVTGKYLRQVRPDMDERLQPAVGFEFEPPGSAPVRQAHPRASAPRKGERSSISSRSCSTTW